MQRRQVRVRLRDQGVVHGDRDLVGVQRARDGVGILAHLRVRAVLLQALVERHAEGALEFLPRAPERVEDLLAVLAVGHLAIVRVGGLVDLHFLAVGELHGRPRHLGVGEDAVGRAGGARGEPEGGDDLLALLVQRVRRRAQDAVEGVAVDREGLVLREEGVHLLRAELEDFGAHERGRFRKLRAQHLRFLAQLEAERLAGVFRVELVRIDAQARETLAELRLPFEALLEFLRRIAEMAAAVARERLDVGGELVGVAVPRLDAREEIGEVPAVFGTFGGDGGEGQGVHEQGGGRDDQDEQALHRRDSGEADIFYVSSPSRFEPCGGSAPPGAAPGWIAKLLPPTDGGAHSSFDRMGAESRPVPRVSVR